MSRASQIFFMMSVVSLIALVVVQVMLGTWMPFMWILAALFVLFLGLGFWQDRLLWKELMGLKTTKNGLSMGSLILLVVIGLAAINFIAARKSKTFDFSMAQVNTLSDQSIKLLKSIDDDLKVIYFYQKGTQGVEENKKAFMDLIRKYQDQSGKVSLEFVEVNQRPDLVKKYGVNTGAGLVFLEYQGRTSRIEKIDEQEITGGLVKVLRKEDKNIYFVIGHGEKELEEQKEANGLALLKQVLEGNRYRVNPLNLNSTGAVPTDAHVVVVAGPTQNFAELEVLALENYLKAGGNLVLAFEDKTDAGLTQLLGKLNLVIEPYFVAQVVDTPLGKAINPSSTPVTEFSQTATITKPFGQGQFINTRLPSPLRRIEAELKGIKLEEIASTNSSAVAFGDTSFKDQKGQGPFVIAAFVTGQLPGSDKSFQATVFGDADLFNNQMLYQNLNRDMILNTIATLVKEENLVSIAPKSVEKTEMTMTDSNFYLYVFLFILPMPLIFLALSGVTWYRRRHA
jgi:ABC-type uncharacterized transport system involved in gliding motility auxiliary subunit